MLPEHTKFCPKCKTDRHILEYAARVRDQPTSFCKYCMPKKVPALKWRMAVVAKKAPTRNGVWRLTLEEYGQLVVKPCFYCKGPLPKSGSGLDRLNSKADYTLDNVVPCCSVCNWVRHDIFNHEEMKEMGALFEKFRANRGLGPNDPILLPVQRYGHKNHLNYRKRQPVPEAGAKPARGRPRKETYKEQQ